MRKKKNREKVTIIKKVKKSDVLKLFFSFLAFFGIAIGLVFLIISSLLSLVNSPTTVIIISDLSISLCAVSITSAWVLAEMSADKWTEEEREAVEIEK